MIIKLDIKLALTSSRHSKIGKVVLWLSLYIKYYITDACFFPQGFFLSTIPQLVTTFPALSFQFSVPSHQDKHHVPVYPVRFFSFLPKESRKSIWAQEWQMSSWYLDPGSDSADGSQELKQMSSEMEHNHCRWNLQAIYTVLQLLQHRNCGFTKGIILARCFKKKKKVNKMNFSSMTVLFPAMTNSRIFAPEYVHTTRSKRSAEILMCYMSHSSKAGKAGMTCCKFNVPVVE